ncbi:MAG: hypothetical protein NC206_03690 [Bacteroides sp.]|nr:hypothetical protein [Roseburia sp.]MCM1346169.1 hypothetical protein [Bacteroides sp.]MCM1420972.1 hypothetical protein [Bacteroides sp.]
MMNVSSSDLVTSQMIPFHTTLKRATWEEVKETESGYVFTDEHLASNWDDIDVYPESLPKGDAIKGMRMRKITSPTLLLKSHSSKMAFILASESSPVYVCSSSKRTKTDGYTMLFSIMPNVFPEYFFYLSKYKDWTGISHTIDSMEAFGLEPGFNEVGLDFFDGYQYHVKCAENVFLRGNSEKYSIPSLSVQRQQIDDAKIMERFILDKMAEKDRKFKQKEWLNEAHIRNSKHRLSNDVMPIRMGIERLEKFVATSAVGVKASSVIGKATGQTVGELLSSLITSIGKIEGDIQRLTESETVGERIETLEVESFIREYCKKVASEYNRHFTIDVQVKDGDLKIKISRKSFIELFENVISNAVRHGFTDDSRSDYKILITLSETNDGYCRIDIANNGNPISERGRKEYFVRGSFAGETGHTGIGGACVFDICEKANGRAIEPYGTDDFPVVISVEFPIV